MDTVYPEEMNAHANNVFWLNDFMHETILNPRLAISHSPLTGLIMTGTIDGLAAWYEADKLLDHGMSCPGNSIKLDMMEIIYLYLTRLYAVPRSEDNFERFFDTVFSEDLEPIINFEIEKLAVVMDMTQCRTILQAIGADENDYDSIRAAQPAFPPI